MPRRAYAYRPARGCLPVTPAFAAYTAFAVFWPFAYLLRRRTARNMNEWTDRAPDTTLLATYFAAMHIRYRDKTTHQTFYRRDNAVRVGR